MGTGEREAAHRPTIADVARLAGTSRGTVSFVVNGRPGVSAATRVRVLKAIDELGWTPNRLARSLSSQRAYAIGLILARDPRDLSADPFFAPFIAGLEAGLEGTGEALLLRFVADEESEIGAYRGMVGEHRVDGFVLTDLLCMEPRIALLESLAVPAVTLNRPDVPSPFPAVSHAEEPAVESAIRYLAGLGHRRIAYVGGPSRYVHSVRRRGAWESTMRALGLEPALFVEADFTGAGGAAATDGLLGLPPRERPTAILYANDLMAVSGMAQAQSRGIAIPAELSIIGFDDSAFSAFLSPTLSSVRTDPFGWGEAAATALLEAIEGGPASSRTIAPAELVVRGSSGPALDEG